MMELGSMVQYTGCCLNSASGEQVGDPGGGSGGGGGGGGEQCDNMYN